MLKKLWLLAALVCAVLMLFSRSKTDPVKRVRLTFITNLAVRSNQPRHLR